MPGTRLSGDKLVLRVLREGRRVDTPWATVYYLPAEELRLGFRAPRRVGKAVVRNRARRRLREALRRLSLPPGYYMVIVKRAAAEAAWEELLSGLSESLSRLGS